MKKNIIKHVSLLLFIISTIFFFWGLYMRNSLSVPIKTAPINKEYTNDKFIVSAYYPYWSGEHFEKIQFDIITHIMYAFAIPSSDGTLLPLENEALAKKLIHLAHENDALILLSIGGWSYNNIPLADTFVKATSSPYKIEMLSNAVLDMCLYYGFDGVDLDWEYPRTNDGSMELYEAFVLSLYEKLSKAGKLFTAAVLCGASADGTIYPESKAYTDKALSCFDYINVMAYDGGEGELHSPVSLAINSARYWNEVRQIPFCKIILGMPFYSNNRIPFYEIASINPEFCHSDKAYINGEYAYYNGIPAISAKTQYALNTLGGIMIWEITQDTDSLDTSLQSVIGDVLCYKGSLKKLY